MPVGPDFISLQVRDLDTAAAFYEDHLGLRRAPASPPGAVVFASEPIPFAVREPLPETDLDSGQPGLGVAVWLRVDDAQVLHDQLTKRGSRSSLTRLTARSVAPSLSGIPTGTR